MNGLDFMLMRQEATNGGPYVEQRRLAWAGILVLILMIFALNLAVRMISRRIQTHAND